VSLFPLFLLISFVNGHIIVQRRQGDTVATAVSGVGFAKDNGSSTEGDEDESANEEHVSWSRLCARMGTYLHMRGTRRMLLRRETMLRVLRVLRPEDRHLGSRNGTL
jgi:hypothetical protein